MIYRYHGTLTTLSPLHHGGDENTGNVRLLRSVKVMQPNGRPVRVPFISGNAIRGVLRRKLMRDLIERVEYTVASPKLHHALYTGGVLETSSETSAMMDIAFRRQLRDAIPPIELFGTAIGNQMISGCLTVNQAMPVCIESEAGLPPVLRMSTTPKRSISDFTFTTRKDDLRDESIDSSQMIVEFEIFSVGVEFTHGFVLSDPSPQAHSALGRMLSLWQGHPYIGGKTASGHGQIHIDYPDTPDERPYLDWIDANKDTVVKTLDGLASRLGRGQKASQTGLGLDD